MHKVSEDFGEEWISWDLLGSNHRGKLSAVTAFRWYSEADPSWTLFIMHSLLLAPQ